MDPVGTLGYSREEEIYTFGDVEAMKKKFEMEKELLERQIKNLQEKVLQVEAKNAKLKANNLELEKKNKKLQPMWCGSYSPPWIGKKV